MIKVDEESLICDLAETYQIYDYKQLPATMVAVFSCGLKDDSRIKMKLSGQEIPLESFLLARISDSLNTLVWFKTTDGQKGRNRPVSMVELLLNHNKRNDDMVVFNSGEDFRKQRLRLIKGGE